MKSERHCANCGAPLARVGGDALCAGCALEVGLEAADPGGFLPRRFGRYELLEEVARGGVGVVYRARETDLDRDVAVKLLLSGPLATPEMVQRFRTEAAAAASLQHPNIVAIHEVGFCDGQHFIAMDYVAGRSLAEIVREGPLEPRRAAAYVKTLAEAIHFAHERKILHRDLKPSNVLVDEFDAPRVTDFGLARRLDAETALTLSGQVLGSPGYMAPEQASGRRGEIGRGTDVYSLGAVLFHLLTGRAPFAAGTVPATLQAVIHTEAVSPRVLVPGLPRDLETICLKCLEKVPARRYATAQELADELARFLRHEPILARPVSRPERLWRWARRKPVLASLIVLVHLVAAVGLAGIVWQWLRAEQNAAEAGTQRDMAEGRLYAAQLRLAHADYQAGRLGSVRQRLEAWRPAPDRPDWRGFEWRWLQRLCAARPGEVLATNASGFFAVAASNDDQTLALGANDGTVKLVDARTGALRRSWPAHPGTVDSVEFIPGHPRRLVTVGGDDGQLKIWDADEVRLLASTPCAKGLLARVAVSPGGRFLAARSATETAVNVWEMIPDSTGGPLQLRRHLSVEGSGPAAFSPDELMLAVANRDGFHLALYTLSSGAVEILQPPQDNFILAVTYSPDGHWIATGGGDETVALWEAGRRVRARVFRDAFANIHALTFSSDGRTLFAATADQNIHGWMLDAPERSLALLRGHGGRVQALARLRNEAVLLSASRDGTVRRWRTDPGSLAQANEIPPEFDTFKVAGAPNPGLGLAVSPDKRSLAVTLFSQVQIFDLASGRVRAAVEATNAFSQAAQDIRSVAFSPDAAFLALGGSGGAVTLLESATLRAVRASLPIHSDQIPHLGFALDGRVLVSAGRFGGGVALTDVNEWRVIRQRPAAGNLPLEPFAISRNGKLLVAATPDHRLTIEEVESGRLVAACPQPVRFLHAVVFSPDGETVAFSDESAAIFLWDTSGRRPLRRLTGHRAEIISLTFSPDGRTLASGSMDHTIRLWHPDLDQEVAILTGHDAWIFQVAFDAAGEAIASVASDGAVRVWRALPLAR